MKHMPGFHIKLDWSVLGRPVTASRSSVRPASTPEKLNSEGEIQCVCEQILRLPGLLHRFPEP